MHVVVVTPPEPVVTLAQAKGQCWIDQDDTSKDVDLQRYIDAATGEIDGPDGWLGRAIGSQELELRANHFPGWGHCGHDLYEGAFGDSLRHGYLQALRLPYPPVTSVLSVVYIDGVGVEQTLDPSAYLLNEHVLSPAYGTLWPSTRVQPDAVKIRYLAGYGESVPAPIAQAILLGVKAMYENREDASVSSSTAAYRLLARYRVVD